MELSALQSLCFEDWLAMQRSMLAQFSAARGSNATDQAPGRPGEALGSCTAGQRPEIPKRWHYGGWENPWENPENPSAKT